MIGIIDSGVGGLSVVAEMQRSAFHQPFVYLGDNANVPYGLKTKSEIITLSLNLVDYLVKEYQITSLIIACNTIVSAAFKEINAAYPTLHIENIVAHGAAGSLQSFQEDVCVLATKMTVESNIYPKYIANYNPDMRVQQLIASQWVTMVEKQEHHLDEIDAILNAIPKTSDVIILGCTHFPFLYKEIRKKVADDVLIIDPAYSCVQHLIEQYRDEPFGKSASIFLTTGEVRAFTDFLENNQIAFPENAVKQILI